MTLVRGLAQKLSSHVVKLASPGAKEWVQALAREVDFIEGDWNALAWAFGSVRALFGYRLAPIRSWDELSFTVEKFAEQKRHRVNDAWVATNFGWLNMLLGISNFGSDLLRAATTRNRIGYGMAVFGTLILTIYFFLRRADPNVPDRGDLTAMTRFYQRELWRACSLSSPDLWIVDLSILAIIVGMVMVQGPAWQTALGIFLAIGFGLFLQMQRIVRRRLEQIEALLHGRN